MHGISLLLAAVIGVDVGWQPTEEGDLEYIIQISPEQLRTLRAGDEIEVGVRPMLRPVRRYRIIVGNEPLPRQTARPAIGGPPPDTIATPDTSAPPTLSLAQPDDTEPAALDHSIVVPAEDAQAAERDAQWIAATELPDSEGIEIRSIPTEPIPALARDASGDVKPPSNLATLPPPPTTEAPSAPLTELPTSKETFVPDYRRQPAVEQTPEADEYQLGDSVPIREAPAADSPVVPPTHRLDLPPPPETVSPPAKLDLPPPPDVPTANAFGVTQTQLQTPAAAESPSVLREHEPTDPTSKPKGVAGSADVTDVTVEKGPTETTLAAQQSGASLWLLLVLFASIGGNIYLSYVTWDIRKRFLAAFLDTSTVKPSSSDPTA